MILTVLILTVKTFRYWDDAKSKLFYKTAQLIDYLKDSEKCNWEGVEVGGRRPVLEVEGSSEELHPQECEDKDEEEEEEEQGDDGPHGAQQRNDKVAKWRPVP